MGCGPARAKLKEAQALLQAEQESSQKLRTELQTARQELLKVEQGNAERLRSELDEARNALQHANAEAQNQENAVDKEREVAKEYRQKVINCEAAVQDLKSKLMKEREYAQRLEDDLEQCKQKPQQDNSMLNIPSGRETPSALKKSKATIGGKAARAKPPDPLAKKVQRSSLVVQRSNLIVDHGTEVALSALYDPEGKPLGEGAFGTVRVAKHKKTKEVRAVKAVPVGKMQSLEREISLMKLMDHPNVIRLYETFVDTVSLYLVMELCNGGELFAALIDKDMFSESEAAVTLQQLFRAVHHMHERKVVHRDLKPENLMLQGTGDVTTQNLKVIDLGLAASFTTGVPLTSRCGTPIYMAPEQVLGSYDERVDMWASGCIMYNLLSGCQPFDGDEEEEVFEMVRVGNYILDPYYWNDISQDAKMLCRWMLTYVPQGRCTAHMALAHKWITKTAPQIKEALPSKVLRNLRNNRQRNLLKKAALQVIALNLSKEQLEKLPDIFLTLDTNSNGMLSTEELMAGLEKIDGGDAGWLVGIMPSDGSEISYTEFIAAAMDKAHYLQKDVCMAAFQTFDRDGSGDISPKELREALLGDAKPDNKSPSMDAAIEAILLEVDKSGDGKIDFDEFMSMMRAVGHGTKAESPRPGGPRKM